MAKTLKEEFQEYVAAMYSDSGPLDPNCGKYLQLKMAFYAGASVIAMEHVTGLHPMLVEAQQFVAELEATTGGAA